jgi:cobalt-zinc-cadmium efflux system outer membrane protein
MIPVWLAGCATVDPRRDFQRLSTHVSQTTGQTVDYAIPDIETRTRVATLLEDGLSAQEAVEVALLNNARLRVAIQSLGAARADVVQAGLFSNPSLSVSLRLPDGGGLASLEAAIAQSIADLWLIPLRKEVAQGQLEQQILEVAREASIIASDARASYYQAVAADRLCELGIENRSTAQQLLDAALARQQAGVGSEIDVNLSRAQFMETELALRTAKLDAFEARRKLATLLGLKTPPGDLRLTDSLPDAPKWDLTVEQLVETAQRQRLDLQAAGRVVRAAEARLRQEKRSVFSNVEVGVAMERSERPPGDDRNLPFDTLRESLRAGELTVPELSRKNDGGQDVITGPTLSLDLPIFDQNQAQIAKAEYRYRQAVLTRDALALEIMQETRAAYERLRTAWDVSGYYRDQVVPLLENNLELSREAYRVGKASFLFVLEAQKQLLAIRTRYVEALRDAAVALAQLETTIGLPIDRMQGAERPSADRD